MDGSRLFFPRLVHQLAQTRDGVLREALAVEELVVGVADLHRGADLVVHVLAQLVRVLQIDAQRRQCAQRQRRTVRLAGERDEVQPVVSRVGDAVRGTISQLHEELPQR